MGLCPPHAREKTAKGQFSGLGRDGFGPRNIDLLVGFRYGTVGHLELLILLSTALGRVPIFCGKTS